MNNKSKYHETRDSSERKKVWLRCFLPLFAYGSYLGIAELVVKFTGIGLPTSELLFYVLWAGAFFCAFWKLRRRSRLTAEEAMASDNRQPVLVLRSFDDDKHMAKMYIAQEVETMLLEALAPLGPVIGIGNPADRIPRPGLSRSYVADSDWKKRILNYMSRAGYVVVLTGTSEGISWEIAQLVKKVDPRKVLLFVGRGKKQYRKFCHEFQDIFPKPLPMYKRGPLVRSAGLSGIVWFTKDWAANFQPMQYRFFYGNEARVINRLRIALAEIMKIKGVPYPYPKFNFREFSINIIFFLILIITILPFVWLSIVSP